MENRANIIGMFVKDCCCVLCKFYESCKSCLLRNVTLNRESYLISNFDSPYASDRYSMSYLAICSFVQRLSQASRILIC